MIEKYLRPSFEFLFANRLAKRIRLSPTFMTLLGCLFGLIGSFLIPFHFRYLAIAFLLLSGFCDMLDGTVARLQGKSSSFGAVCDIVTDRLIEFTIILGLFLLDPLTRGLPALLMLGSILLCITSFLVVGIFTKNASQKSFHYSPGLIERPEAFCFFVAMILFPSFFTLLAYLFSFLVFLTSGVRLKQFSRLPFST